MFVISKVVGFLIAPLTVVLSLFSLGVLLRALGFRRGGVAAGWLALMMTAVIVLTPLPEAMLRSLERQYTRPAPLDPDAFAGAIVLGGGQGRGDLARERNTYQLNEAGERLVAVAELRALKDDFPVIMSGHSGRVRAMGWNEARISRAFLAAVGIDPDTVIFEQRSRNTHQNAVYTAALLPQDERRPWLLVSSAVHLPRAMRIFAGQGIAVTAFPVDHRAPVPAWTLDRINPADRFAWLDSALHEHVGMFYHELLQAR